MRTLVIGLGGLGLNLVQALISEKAKGVTGSVDYLMIDGSDSNFSNPEAESLFWRVPETDGGGKNRAKCFEAYSEFIKSKLSALPVADMYILVYSLSGASGSTLAPLMNLALMEKGLNTLNVVLGTTNSRTDVINTANTLTGLANNVNTLNRPIHLILENSNDSDGNRIKESELNGIMLDHINQLCRICSSEHSRLDTSDIDAWLNYHTRDIKPMLGMIERFDDVELLNKGETSIVTTLSLLADADNPLPSVGAVLGTYGVCSNDTNGDTHFVTTAASVANYKTMLDKMIAQYNTASDSLTTKDVFSSSDNANDKGFVF